jgi:hypothetical protein
MMGLAAMGFVGTVQAQVAEVRASRTERAT